MEKIFFLLITFVLSCCTTIPADEKNYDNELKKVLTFLHKNTKPNTITYFNKKTKRLESTPNFKNPVEGIASKYPKMY